MKNILHPKRIFSKNSAVEAICNEKTKKVIKFYHYISMVVAILDNAILIKYISPEESSKR